MYSLFSAPGNMSILKSHTKIVLMRNWKSWMSFRSNCIWEVISEPWCLLESRFLLNLNFIYHSPLAHTLLPLVSLFFFKFTFFLWAHFYLRAFALPLWNSLHQDAYTGLLWWILSPQRGEHTKSPLSAHFSNHLLHFEFIISCQLSFLDSPVRAEIFVCLAYSFILRPRKKRYTWKSLQQCLLNPCLKVGSESRKPHLKQYFLQCGPWTCNFSITWEIVSNAYSWASKSC